MIKKPKHTPVRMCASCRERAPQRELWRFGLRGGVAFLRGAKNAGVGVGANANDKNGDKNADKTGKTEAKNVGENGSATPAIPAKSALGGRSFYLCGECVASGKTREKVAKRMKIIFEEL